MKRRDFIKRATGTAAVGALAAAASTFPKPAVAQGKKQLKMVTSWPKNFPGLGTAANRLAKRISDMSEGKYSVKVYAGGELVHPLKCLDAVQEGVADLYHSAEYYYQGKTKAFNFFAAVPFGLTATEMNAWIYHGGGQKLWDEVSGQFGVKPLMAGNTGVQMGGWFRKEMNSVDDYKGLKMRIPGLGGAVVTKLGGTSVTLAGGEVFQALQAGTIDATEWVGPWNDLAFGFYKVAKYYYYPGFHEPGTVLSFGISRKLWDAIPQSEKAMFEAAAAAENDVNLAEFNANNSAALDTLVNKHNVKVRKFPNEVLQAIGHAAGEVVVESTEGDAMAKKVYDSFIAFRRIAIGWSKLSDQAFWNARILPFKYG